MNETFNKEKDFEKGIKKKSWKYKAQRMRVKHTQFRASLTNRLEERGEKKHQDATSWLISQGPG